MELKARLRAAADFVKAGEVVADIGTDHAYLPAYLVARGLVPYAFACDIGEGPCRAARRTVAAAGLQSQIEVRRGDGLTALRPGEAQTAVLAGMGGRAMIDILQSAPQVTASLRALVLQPMNSAAALRCWLTEHGWRIAGETLVEEEGRMYEVLAAEPGAMTIEAPILLEIGPCLWARRHPLLKSHVENLLERARRTLAAMSDSERARQSEKYARTAQRARDLEERLKWL